MTLPEWFGIGIGGTCYLWAWRYFAGKIAWSEKHSSAETPSGSDIAEGIVIGVFAAALSPVLFPWFVLRDHGKHEAIREFILYRVLHVPKEHQ